MMEKIEWYKEVLELEPNSKVFFPLARLLANEKLYEEAIEVLEKGLDRHPEFLEARLFLIEILYAIKQLEKCDYQVQKLDKMFASYSGFWQAWAACLAQQSKMADTASVLRFLAAHFVSGPLQLHDVLNRGISSLLKEKGFNYNSGLPLINNDQISGTSPTSSDKHSIPSNTNVKDNSDIDRVFETLESSPVLSPDGNIKDSVQSEELQKNHISESISNHTDSIEDQSTITFQEPEEIISSQVAEDKNTSRINETQEQGINKKDEKVIESANTKITSQSEEMTISVPHVNVKSPAEEEVFKAEKNMLDEMALPEDDDTSSSLPLVEQMALPDEDIPNSNGIINQNSDVNDQSNSLNIKNSKENIEDGNPEQFSIRTKSMAEVLAEQGDLQSALDIYQELAETANNPEEVEEFRKRIASLKSRMNSENTALVHEHEEVSKEKLIDMLEALAHRVEERVNNPVELS